MTGIDLDLAGIRARAEAFDVWDANTCRAFQEALPSDTVIAMLDFIERQAGEIARLKAVIDRAQIPVAALRDDLALRMSAVVAEIAVENGTTPAEVLGGTLVFLRRANEQRRAALTPKEDTPCRTA